MPEDATTTLRQIVPFALKALGAAGVPGASVAADAVDMVAKRLDARRAEAALCQALNAASDRLSQEVQSVVYNQLQNLGKKSDQQEVGLPARRRSLLEPGLCGWEDYARVCHLIRQRLSWEER